MMSKVDSGTKASRVRLYDQQSILESIGRRSESHGIAGGERLSAYFFKVNIESAVGVVL